MAKKILAVYFTQTGQLRSLVEAITRPLAAAPNIEVIHEELKPKIAFPFPWSFDSFFEVMPESVLGIPCEIAPLSTDETANYDLILLAYQPWFLSPCLPVHAFLQSPAAAGLLAGKPVLTVSGSRNMWISAHEDVCKLVREAGGRPVGNISLCDPAPNMMSAVTIVRWMLKGKKDPFWGIFPPAGISDNDLHSASRFAPLIKKAVLTGNLETLRPELIKASAVTVIPDLALLETRVKPIFRLWARFIRAGGAPGRILRMRLFQCYLLFVLYLVSPLISLVFQMVKPFRKDAIRERMAEILAR